jgi:hypothetical protein
MMIHKQMNNNEKNRTQKAKGSRMRNKRQPEEHTDSSISSRLHHRERKKKTKFRGAPHTLRAQLNVGVLFSSFRCFCRVLSSPSSESADSSRVPSPVSAESSRVPSPVSAESTRVPSPVSAESSRVPSPVSAESSLESPFHNLT